MDTELPFRHSAAPGILGGIAGLLGAEVSDPLEKPAKKMEEKRKRGMAW